MDQLDGARVLLVDDSAYARRRLGTLLDTAGAVVTAVASSADALAALGKGSYDVLVCDLRLADTDGYSLMRSIRGGAVAGSAAIRSVAMTAHADDETRQKALDAGFDDFLPKLVGALLVPTVARLRQPM